MILLCECGAYVTDFSSDVRWTGSGPAHRCRPDVPQAGHCGRLEEVTDADACNRITQLRKALEFAACTIKNGEAWSDTCERVIGAAIHQDWEDAQ